MELVTKKCRCGATTHERVYCHQSAPKCGKVCEKPLPCGHFCNKVCCASCFPSKEELMANGCGQRCNAPRKNCPHRCQAKCHPGKECPDIPCTAEMRHYCRCGHRFVVTICKSMPDRKPLDCNATCWKVQRQKKIDAAFSTDEKIEESKESFKFEYYPEHILDYAAKNVNTAKRLESMLQDIVHNKGSKSFTNLGGARRNFIGTYVYEHFHLDMCTFKGTDATVTDVFWKEGARVPSILASEVIALVERGIVGAADEQLSKIFEASILVPHIPKGSTVNDLKALLASYANEFYAEATGEAARANRACQLHFYKLQRAKDAYKELKEGIHAFGGADLVTYRREIGTSDGPVGFGTLGEQPKRKRAAGEEDEDGFTVVKY